VAIPDNQRGEIFFSLNKYKGVGNKVNKRDRFLDATFPLRIFQQMLHAITLAMKVK
jgi:hypothetical protein